MSRLRRAAAQKRHAKRRALERHGLSDVSLKKIVADIQRGKAQFVERQSLRVTKWLVTVGGKQVLVVYDNKSHTVATFLPENARELAATEEG
jgi:hypothetical protein